MQVFMCLCVFMCVCVCLCVCDCVHACVSMCVIASCPLASLHPHVPHECPQTSTHPNTREFLTRSLPNRRLGSPKLQIHSHFSTHTIKPGIYHAHSSYIPHHVHRTHALHTHTHTHTHTRAHTHTHMHARLLKIVPASACCG